MIMFFYKMFCENFSLEAIHGLDFKTGYTICSDRFCSFFQKQTETAGLKSLNEHVPFEEITSEKSACIIQIL